MSYMGVDIGTTGCKAAVYSRDGKCLSQAYREYPLLCELPGWAELDSRRVMEDCEAVIRQAASEAGEPVQTLCVSSQGEAFTAVGAGGEFLCRAMVSSDCRAAEYAETFKDDFGSERLYRITGHTAHPMFTLFKLLWLKRHKREIWERAKYFLCFEDLLHLRLGLQPGIGYPLAGRTMLFDIERKEWSPDILDRLGISQERLARPLASGSAVGVIPGKTAAELGLPGGVTVLAGGHDQTIAALGVGVTSGGTAMYAMGTVECVCSAFSELRQDASLHRANLCTYNYSVGELYSSVAFSLTGGNLLKWFRDQFGASARDEAERRGEDSYKCLLEAMPESPSNLLVLPYFTPSGTPYFDPAAKGAIIGLTLQTSRYEILRGLLEGVAMEMRLNLEIMAAAGLGVRRLIATGGGARSDILCQLKADVLGLPLSRCPHEEAGCYGGGKLGMAFTEGISVSDLKIAEGEGKTFIPNHETATLYGERFAAYRSLYPAIRKLAISA